MKSSRTVAAWITVVSCVLAGPRVPATTIDWGAGRQGILGATDVGTAGTLKYAYNVGQTAAGSFAINGVTFVNSGFAAAGIAVVSGTGMNSSDLAGSGLPGFYGSTLTPFSSLATANYQTMLSQGLYGYAGEFTLTLTDLTPQHTYLFQWWVNDSAYQCGNPMLVTATLGNSVTLSSRSNRDTPYTGQSPYTDYNAGDIGQFATGTFRATSSSAVIDFVASPAGTSGINILNGYQLRDLGLIVPEPSVILLLIVGGAIACRYQRRR